MQANFVIDANNIFLKVLFVEIGDFSTYNKNLFLCLRCCGVTVESNKGKVTLAITWQGENGGHSRAYVLADYGEKSGGISQHVADRLMGIFLKCYFCEPSTFPLKIDIREPINIKALEDEYLTKPEEDLVKHEPTTAA